MSGHKDIDKHDIDHDTYGNRGEAWYGDKDD